VVAFTDEIAERGGGLAGAEEVVRARLDSDTAERVFDEWDPDRLREVFQQLYLGSALYEELEGGEAELDTRATSTTNPCWSLQRRSSG